jgi:nucleoside-diphosphate-sugar epimerase
MSPIVFLTGGTGYVGRHVIDVLTTAGWTVRALTRRARAVQGEGVMPVVGDLTRVDSFARGLDGCTALVHCARASHEDSTERARQDVNGTLALWEAARQAGVRRCIHVSTMSVYALPAEGTVDETSPYTTSDDPYARSKVAIEQALLAQTHGPELGILQPGCVYGASGGWWTGTLPDLMRRGTLLVPDYGRGIANLIHVEDLAGAVLAALTVDTISGRFIITDGRPITWAEFYDVLEAVVGHSATLRVSTEEARVLAAQALDHRLLARVRRAVIRRLTGRPPVFGQDGHAITQAVSRAVLSPARAASVLGFRAQRVFGAETSGV